MLFVTGKPSSLRAPAAIAIAALALTTSGPASAEFTLKGRTVNIYIGGGIGGAIDAVGRTILPYLARHLPGEPTVVAGNMPGSGGVQGAQYLFNVAARDGSAAGTINAGPLIDPLIRDGLGYDPRKFRWIGSLFKGDTVCSVWHLSPVKSIKDAQARDVPMASTGATSTPLRSALLMNALIGTRFKPISGFDGGNALLAIERGEVEGFCNQLASQRMTRPQWMKEGKLRPIVQISMTADPDYPDVPRAIDLIASAADRRVLEFYLLPWEINHPFMLPPGAPDEAVAAWRAAFDKAVKDPGYLADAAARSQKIDPHGGEDVTRLVDHLFATPRDIIERTNAATTPRP